VAAEQGHEHNRRDQEHRYDCQREDTSAVVLVAEVHGSDSACLHDGICLTAHEVLRRGEGVVLFDAVIITRDLFDLYAKMRFEVPYSITGCRVRGRAILITGWPGAEEP
jgi:hypothetical protein